MPGPWEKYGQPSGPWAKYAAPDQIAANPGEYDPSSPEFQRRYGPTAAPSGGVLTSADEYRDAAAGAGKAFVDVGRGIGQYLGLVSRDDVRSSRQLDAPLMATDAGKIGNIAGGIATAAPAMLVPGANTVVGAGIVGGVYGALQPSTSTRETLTNTAVGAATGAATQYIGQKVSNWVGQRIASREQTAATQQAQNQVRDLTLSEARRAGYVVPPATTNPTAANRIVESVSGKAATQQSAAVRNQQVTNSLVRQDLGLPETAPLTVETLKGLREQAGQAYRAMKNIGRITVDDAYLNDLTGLVSSVDEIAKDFPEANVAAGKEINELVDSLLKDNFNAASAVEYAKQLRADAASNLSFAAAANPQNRAIGRAQWEAAGALEDMIQRHLERSGKGALAEQFNRSRVLIAKTYTVESALNPGTGNVIATALGRELKRGKPLTGGIATAAKFAQAFPRVAQEITHSPGVSAVDALVGGVGGAAVNPALLGIPAARVGTREAILSGPYQNAFTTPNYSPNTAALEFIRGSADRALPIGLAVAPYSSQQ